MMRILLVVVLESSTAGAPCHVDISNVVQNCFRIKQASFFFFLRGAPGKDNVLFGHGVRCSAFLFLYKDLTVHRRDGAGI